MRKVGILPARDCEAGYAHAFTPLQPGQVTRLQAHKGHDKLGVVVSSSSDLISYIVNVNGTEYRRNRWHIGPAMNLSHVISKLHRGGGHSHRPMEVTGMCGHDPQSRGLSVTD